MSKKILGALEKACNGLHDKLQECAYLVNDCCACLEINQANFNELVFDYGGEFEEARTALRKRVKVDRKELLRDLAGVRKAIEALEKALPPALDVQLLAIDKFDYTGPDEGDDDFEACH